MSSKFLLKIDFRDRQATGRRKTTEIDFNFAFFRGLFHTICFNQRFPRGSLKACGFEA
jgi:hypothetical protein